MASLNMVSPSLPAGVAEGSRAPVQVDGAQPGARAARAERLVDAFLRVYAQILFSRSPAVGLLVFAATATVPRALLAGAAAVLVATVTARALDLDREAIRGGDYAYNALLVGLGVGQMFGGAEAAVLLVLGAAASVGLTASLRAWLGGAVALPVLSIPFLAAIQVVLGTSAVVGAVRLEVAHTPSALAAVLPAGVVLFVKSLGGLFFLPRLDAGALVLSALLLHSRIAASLAASGFAVAFLLVGAASTLPWNLTAEGLSYNAMLSAMALGGVFFVPSVSSFLLAVAAATLSVLLAAGLAGPFGQLGVPLLIVPFNLTVLLSLLALRKRVQDLRPKSVDFLPGTPEENLAYYRTRRSRFEWLYPVAFQLPVRGRWSCTQAIDGAFTHQGDWRHAYDFEVRDAEGRLASEGATSVEQYHCWRLPVVAAAEGTVVAVEISIPDNAVGAVDVTRNWGNHVILQHGVGLYSLVAHLSRGSVKVVLGQYVRRGEVLGLAGSSGRAPRPHVHFHLQGTAVLGAPTLLCRFTDVVRDRGARVDAVEKALAPAEGDTLRNLEPSDEMASYLAFKLGDTWTFEQGRSVEHLTCDLDLYGRSLVSSRELPATLFYGQGEGFYTSYDVLGPKRSVLQLFRVALPRVPFEANETLAWTDHLPARPFRPWWTRGLFDVLSPFLAQDGIEMHLRMRREGSRLVIEGESMRRDRRGEPLLRTRAELERGRGPCCVDVVAFGKRRSAVRILEGAGS